VTRLLATRRLFVIILGLGLLAMAARGVHDPDLWWHLRTGQEIVATHHVPHRDIFSYTRFGQPWIAHEWLSEVLLYLIFRVTGWAGLIVTFALVIAATFFLLYRQCAGKPYVAGLIVALGAVATIPSWGVRPQMLSLVLAAIFLGLLGKAERAGPNKLRFLWWMPPLLLLWVNLHGGFLLGPAFIALALAGWALEAWLGLRPWPDASARLRQLGTVLAACLVLVPLNPNGWEIYRYPFQTLQSRTMMQYITEWASPNFHSPDFKPFLLLLLLTWAAVAASHKRLSPTRILLLLAMGYAGLISGRHIPIFILVAVPVIAESLAEQAEQHRWLTLASDSPASPRVPKLLANLVLLLAMSVFVAIRFAGVIKGQSASEARYFPQAATRFIARQNLPGPIFNNYDWGGYFIAKLYPQYQVFIDGRADLYGKLMDTFIDAAQAQGEWQQPLEEYRVRTVVLPPTSGLAGVLRLDPHWNKRFEGKQAVVFVRGIPY
jgi:hypothetical protein